MQYLLYYGIVLTPREPERERQGCDTCRVTFDPYAPYGTLAESAVRVVTWNVWGRYGPAWCSMTAGK